MKKNQKTIIDTSGMSFEEAKKLAIANEPLVHKTKLSAIDFRNGQLSIEGQPVQAEDNIGKKMLKLLGLGPAFVQRFGKLVGKESEEAMVDMVKTALTLSDNKKKLVTVLGNPVTKQIFNFIPGDKDFISNKFAMEQFERIQQKYPFLKTHALHLHKDGGFNLVLKTNEVVNPLDNRGNLIENPNGDTEAYNPGISLIVDPERGILNQIYMWRLICSNGMEGLSAEDGGLKVNSLSSDQLTKFFKDVDAMALTNFASVDYNANLERAMSTNASFAELNYAKNVMLKHSALTEANLDSFLPEFKIATRKLAAKGYPDFTKFTDAQLANYQTGTSMWDLVNRVTDFGSHDYGFGANYQAIQSKAGQRLFGKKTYDSENLILAA